ncbi:restriction endonuclease subunit S [Bacillus cereus]|uniref:restriction endonuclease subunit S n=1 Tax=Bacillus cereus TaxID=1396 RepID=UPI001C92DF90|nr:restriction endonuclease subunit S [Bacillus cereus]
MLTRKMKDSGVEWIGEIPVNWEMKKVKSFLRERSEKNHANEEVLSLYRDYGVIPKNSRNDNHNVTSQDTSSYKFVKKDNVVINKMKAWQGSLAVSRYQGIISPAYYIYEIKNAEEIVPEFLHYALRNPLYTQEYKRLSAGLRVGQWDLNKSQFNSLLYPIPSVKVQIKIVDYLNEKLNLIDELVEDTKQSIEELKKYKQALITETVTKGLDKNVEMKNSGLDGSLILPKHWKINKVRNVFRMNKGLTITKENLQSEGISVISYGEIHSKYGFRFDPDKHDVKKVAESYIDSNELALLQQGDFIFADTSEDIEGSGNFTCYVGSQTCFAGYHTIVLKPIQKVNFNFLAYLFESKVFRAQIQKKVQGIKVYSITQRILKPLTVWFPPEGEQQKIVKFLDKKVERIDTLVSEKKQVIQELEAYKKSLIYEYVTGKKEV